MADVFAEFEKACVAAFAFLVDQYGFAAPQSEQLGREYYVRYHRGLQTVSIAYEPGSPPVVELFYPVAGTTEAEVPWTQKDGVARTRKIPKLGSASSDVGSTAEYFNTILTKCAASLQDTEARWLAA